MHRSVRTICLGRFLMVVPQGARVRASYITAGTRVFTDVGVSHEGFEARVGKRHAELQSASHAEGGPMLVERYALTPLHEVLVSWASSASRRVYRYEEFQHFPDQQILFRFDGEGTATQQARATAREAQERFSSLMRVRGVDEVPEQTGFCIERGFVTGSRLNREEVEAGIELRGAPGTQLAFTSFVTRNPEPSLLERSRSISEVRPESVGEGSFALRRAERAAAGLQGAELLMLGNDGGEHSYEFMWEFRGTPDSLAAPFLKLALSLEPGAVGLGRDFADLKAATTFWDQLVDSLRLRPGAI
ncbi:T6SS immunity protein Tli4 family protein [Luteimonas sp. A478]